MDYEERMTAAFTVLDLQETRNYSQVTKKYELERTTLAKQSPGRSFYQNPDNGARGCFRGLVCDEPVAELSTSTPLTLFGRSVRHILDTGRNFIVGFEVHGVGDFNMTVEARPAWIVGKAGGIDDKVVQFQAFGELVGEFIGLIELLFLSRRQQG
jgi:hypothetical protein